MKSNDWKRVFKLGPLGLALAITSALAAGIAPWQDTTSAPRLRQFLFIGEPNAAAWKWMVENPQDREAAMAKPIEKLGGRMLSYYWGIGNGRNYITVALPDDPELIQATYVARLGDGLLVSYEMIELMTSADMAAALKRVSEVKRAEGSK
jgi:uncharacterized protein with GYD domain